MPPSMSNGGASPEANRCKYIEHRVTRMDTLAGIAIKYGVEVADIKRMNCLSTDLQMFALKILRIPLPGRHPPSPVPFDGAAYSREKSPEKSPSCNGNLIVLEPFESLRLKPSQKNVSPAMSTLQKYYGLRLPVLKSVSEGMEMAVYRSGTSRSYEAAVHPPKQSSIGDSTHKEDNLGNGFMLEDSGMAEYGLLINIGDESSGEHSVRRRQKAESNPGIGTPEKLMKEDNSGGSSIFSAINGKNLDLRRKSASRTSLVADAESSWSNLIPAFGDSSNPDESVSVRKSYSLSSLQDSECNGTSSLLKWTRKTELPGVSAASIAKPIFDGIPIPIPISGRRNKAAMD
ncbi:hypothetical protein SAY86_006666 [Trapa natans]|uniref:LysM domain-containing protein n=1 Tax=Trapa natans TaxID=22666 RepID=A0AAN7LA73_TRANT|nr:hypothetical protein SAY86_006666 [Trapa natans]